MSFNDILEFYYVFFSETWENAPIVLVLTLTGLSIVVGVLVWYAVDWIGYGAEKAWEAISKMVDDVFHKKQDIHH